MGLTHYYIHPKLVKDPNPKKMKYQKKFEISDQSDMDILKDALDSEEEYFIEGEYYHFAGCGDMYMYVQVRFLLSQVINIYVKRTTQGKPVYVTVISSIIYQFKASIKISHSKCD